MIGVAGAGAMGSEIAALACVAGHPARLWDPDPEALSGGVQRAVAALAGGAERGRWPAGLDELLQPAPELDDLAGCDVIVEAAPERLELKQSLFRRLAEVAPGAVLASNTSSLAITAIAAGVADPSRVVGMHFFNPPTRMKLVEVVAGLQSGTDALDRVRTLGAAMGKRVIDAADGPGFIVNRCNRPFFGEALRVVSDGVADVVTVDRAVRVGGGFRMGPFELQDLVGIDVALDVARAFDERSFGEPRWRPSPLMAMQVDAGWTGRKAGRGWYSYPDGPPADPDAVAERVEPGVAAIIGDWRIAVELRERARAAGWVVQEQVDAGPPPAVVIRCDGAVAAPDVPCGVLVAAGSLHQLDPNGRAVGFHAVPPMRDRDLVELTAADPEAESSRAVQSFFESLGWLTAWVGDAPGLVLGRLVAQLVNEAFFAVAEGAGGARDIDDGMLLGLNHPLGPLDWGDRMGLRHVLAILDALRAELGEERYRAAPLLRRCAGAALPELAPV